MKQTIGIINDFYGVDLNMKINDVKKLTKLLEDNIEVFGALKMAVVVDSHKSIVFPIVADKFSAKVNIRPFSTFGYARDWILSIVE